MRSLSEAICNCPAVLRKAKRTVCGLFIFIFTTNRSRAGLGNTWAQLLPEMLLTAVPVQFTVMGADCTVAGETQGASAVTMAYTWAFAGMLLAVSGLPVPAALPLINHATCGFVPPLVMLA
jgi:hypothetical protein